MVEHGNRAADRSDPGRAPRSTWRGYATHRTMHDGRIITRRRRRDHRGDGREIIGLDSVVIRIRSAARRSSCPQRARTAACRRCDTAPTRRPELRLESRMAAKPLSDVQSHEQSGMRCSCSAELFATSASTPGRSNASTPGCPTGSTSGNGRSPTTSAQVADTVDALATSVAALELTPGEFRAGGSGDVGWFALTFHARRTVPDGRVFESDGRWTAVAAMVDGRWLIVHDHASIPLPTKPWQ